MGRESVRGDLSRIDPSTNEVSKTIAIGGTPRDVTAGEGLWVSDAGASCGKPLYEATESRDTSSF